MSNIFRLSIILAIVTAVAALVLAEIYSITKPQIELQKQAKTQEALNTVLPESEEIKPVTEQVPVKDGDGNVLYKKDHILYYRGYTSGDTTDPVGFAFKAEGQGYSSLIETMVGIDPSGKIKKIEIISQQETPGLGALSVQDEPFTGKKWSTRQFEGKTADQLKVDKDGGEIVSITGATITSRAITNSIREELKVLLPRMKKTAEDENGG